MAKRMPTYFPQGARLRVRDMAMFGNVQGHAAIYAELGAPVASHPTLILSGQDQGTAGSTSTFASGFTNSEAQMGRFGRALQIVASGASTSTVTVRGRDYLQQYVSETLTLNGTTTVNGLKAFRYIDSVAWAGTAATTLNVGVRNTFGLPYKFLTLGQELKDQAPAANAGTFVAGLANTSASTATSADVRGTYTPATVLPDGVRTFAVHYRADYNNGHGNTQYYA